MATAAQIALLVVKQLDFTATLIPLPNSHTTFYRYWFLWRSAATRDTDDSRTHRRQRRPYRACPMLSVVAVARPRRASPTASHSSQGRPSPISRCCGGGDRACANSQCKKFTARKIVEDMCVGLRYIGLGYMVRTSVISLNTPRIATCAYQTLSPATHSAGGRARGF